MQNGVSERGVFWVLVICATLTVTVCGPGGSYRWVKIVCVTKSSACVLNDRILTKCADRSIIVHVELLISYFIFNFRRTNKALCALFAQCL